MIRKILLFLVLLSLQTIAVRAEHRIGPGTDALAEKNHPRLFISDAEFDLLKAKVAMPENEELATMNRIIIKLADNVLTRDHLKYKRDISGRRILGVSRNAITHITSCAYAYRMTGDRRYLDYAETELNTVCAFENWNESHFLDVAEMAIGVSVGYDWLYDELSQQTRETVAEALYQKAVVPALYREKPPRFYRMKNNWNQVCNGGLVAAAIAICDRYPQDAKTIVEKAVKTNAEPMRVMYSPDGNYVEGYDYWQFGTLYQVLMLKMLEQSYGTDFGLSEIPGFLDTADYMMFLKGIRGPFNYSDCGRKGGSAVPMWYFAEKLGRPELLYNELAFMRAKSYKVFPGFRLLPLIMGCAVNIDMSAIEKPRKNIWCGEGENPVVLIRKDWTSSDSDAFLAAKAGKASNSHGHMDAGSFVYDAQGVRWAMDLGMQKYGKVEKAFKGTGGSLWKYDQDSRRWSILRYNNYHHNTVTLNDQLHKADGAAKVKRFIDTEEEKGIVMDMTDVFAGQAQSLERTVKMLEDGSAVVTDQVVALAGSPVKYSWRMVTEAQPEITRKCIILRSGGKKIRLQAESSCKFRYTTWSADPKESYDEPNEGVSIVGIEAEVPAGKTAGFTVTLSR